MAECVLVPVDESEHARHAVDLALEEFPGADLLLLHAINPAGTGFTTNASFPSFSEDWYEDAEDRAESLLDDLESTATGHGVEVDRAVEVGQPVRIIVEYTEELEIDHVVMGSHGREGVTRVLLGSVAEAVIRRSPVPVTVTR